MQCADLYYSMWRIVGTTNDTSLFQHSIEPSCVYWPSRRRCWCHRWIWNEVHSHFSPLQSRDASRRKFTPRHKITIVHVCTDFILTVCRICRYAYSIQVKSTIKKKKQKCNGIVNSFDCSLIACEQVTWDCI